MMFLALQGVPLVGIGGATEWTYESGPVDTTKPSLCLMSAADVPRGEATAYGTDDAPEMLRTALAWWLEDPQVGVRDLHVRVQWPRHGYQELPLVVPRGEHGGYRFGRGDAAFTAWYE
jgi:hypothetical protein